MIYPEPIARLMLESAEIKIRSQLLVAIAADNRAMLTAVAIMLATILAVVSGGLVFPTIASGVLLFAVLIVLVSCWPCNFQVGGSEPNCWDEEDVDMEEILAEEIAHRQHYIEFNSNVLKRNSALYRVGLGVAVFAILLDVIL